MEGSFGTETFEFDSPEDINESYVRHAQLQASIGLWKETSFLGLFFSKIKINKPYYQILGFRVQHNISQWIPSIYKTSFNLAGLVTYSFYSVSDTLSAVNSSNETLNSIVVYGELLMFNLVAFK